MTIPSIRKTDVVKFLMLAKKIPVVDVRSPSEFSRGHIPGAINIPLFDDEERKAVGIAYKKEGRTAAILKGLGLIGPKIHLKLKQALELAQPDTLLVYCWRGGMRSETMAWLFALGDVNVEILRGGYKNYRNHILSGFRDNRKIIILGGMTGSSKTRILHHLRSLGQQVIDLEGLANHKGSAFGGLGQLPQPSSEYFANLLYAEWSDLNSDQPVWIEDESKNIGKVFMPDDFYNVIQESPALILMIEPGKRIPGLTEEYATYPTDQLKESIKKVSRRLGGEKTREILDAVDTGDLVKAVELMLIYYDKTYDHSLSRKRSKNVIYVETDTIDIETNSKKVLEASYKITW
jgi:tRNA 2-selenouridine synthase